MSKNEEPEIVVSIDEWVDKAKADPEAYLERQATEIFLTTLGTTQPYCQKFFLKGGLLMGIVYDSPRQTVDIDFSTDLEPDTKIAEQLKQALNDTFLATAARLGYPDIVCQVQTIGFRPREKDFKQMTSPAFKITIGYAKRGTTQEKRLLEKNAAKVLHADISFNEPVGAIQIVRLGENGAAISAYSLKDIIAEKYRAFMQQEKRRTRRRQDIYDLSLLLEKFSFDDEEKQEILDLLIEKSKARDIHPDRNSLQSDTNIERAKSEWATLEQEIGELPDFDHCYAIANDFYSSLPWKE